MQRATCNVATCSALSAQHATRARRDSPDRTPCGPGGSSWRNAAGLPTGTPVRFYGVYDGHSGCLAAQFLKATLHVNFRGDPMYARVAPGSL